jgi:hypothetical protein
MPPENILNKARKLMAMTTENGTTEAEAQAAALKLQILLEKHNLSYSGLNKKEQKSKAEFIEIPYPSKRKNHYFIDLANTVAYGYNSEVIISPNNIEFIGIGANAIIASEMFTYLWNLLNKIGRDKARQNGQKGGGISSYKNSFISGAAVQLWSRFDEHKQVKAKNQKQTNFSLVQVDVLEEIIKDRYPNLKAYSKITTSTNKDARLDGFIAAENIPLDEQLETEKEVVLSIETELNDEHEQLEKELTIDEVVSFVNEVPNVTETFKSLFLNSGLTPYKVARYGNIDRTILTAWKKGKSVKINLETVVKLATFFELNIEHMIMAYSLQKSKSVQASIKGIKTAKNFIKYITSKDVCIHCYEEIRSYVTTQPDYGDSYQVQCNHCESFTPAMTSKLKITSSLKSRAVKAILLN